MSQDLNLSKFVDLYGESAEFIPLNADKSPRIKKWSGTGSTRYKLKEIFSEQNIGMIVPPNYCVIDIDNKDNPETSTKLINLITRLKLKTSILETTRGHHFFFHCSIAKPYTDTLLALGIKADIKTGFKNAYTMIKQNGKWRKWIQLLEPQKLDYLPRFLTPIGGRIAEKIAELDTPTNLVEGSRRNNFFARVFPLYRLGYSKQEIIDIITYLNIFFVSKPISGHEIKKIFDGFDNIFINQNLTPDYDKDNQGDNQELFANLEATTRQEGLPSPFEFFQGSKFKHNLLADYLIEKYHIKIFNELIYFYNGYIYVCDEVKLNGKMLEIVPDLTMRQIQEVTKNILNKPTITYAELEFNIVALKNNLVNINTREIMPFDPKYFIINQLPIDYDDKADDSQIQRFLKQICSNDIQLVQILMEFLGYCLTGDLRYQKALLLFGPSAANGKSTFLSLVIALFGKTNTSNIALENVGKRFQTANLLNKMINIGGDISVDHIKEPATLKNLITGDIITAEFKGRDVFSFENKAKMIFATNKLPSSGERSNGFFRRFIILPFLTQFKGDNVDINILDKLRTPANLSALFNLALQGYSRLKTNGEFTHSQKASLLLELYAKKKQPCYFVTWGKCKTTWRKRKNLPQKRNYYSPIITLWYIFKLPKLLWKIWL
ncbi:phage/plasmid primase, P4 family, C-terminal domain (plasmid) [Mesomycoplasma conjunctivae]|nr:phage/plasmid primase, P4 family, C-terminal domain [Mesomycoplasma conjunctivae]